AALGLPVLLVVGMRLGCLNHALATALAVQRRGLVLAGWVANALPPPMALLTQNVEALAERLGSKPLALVAAGEGSVLTFASFEVRASTDARCFRARQESRQAWHGHVMNEGTHGI